MNAKLHKSALLVMLCVILLAISITIVQAGHRTSVVDRMQQAQGIAALSGQYEFRTNITQTSNYAPSITNYGRPSRIDELVVTGAINESKQTSSLSVANQHGLLLEIRHEQGRTYSRQPGGTWQAGNSLASAGIINSLNFMSGITHATVDAKNENSYNFDFNGAAFVDHFARLLKADAARGVSYNQEWHAIAQSATFHKATGDGVLEVDADGLPKSLHMDILIPGDTKTGASRTAIHTTFFAYARTGLALQKMLNNPLRMVSLWVGSDVPTVGLWILRVSALFALAGMSYVVIAFRRRLMAPLTFVFIGVLIYQPFSTVPRASAATQQAPTPIAGAQSGNTTPAAPQVFNPLVAPVQQFGGIVLPSAGTATVGESTAAVLPNGRADFTSRAANGEVDTDSDRLSDTDEQARQTSTTKSDTDNDGLTDYDEVQLGTNPLSSDADKDTLSDSAEIQLGTNPNSADTDLDGLTDTVEVKSFTQYPGSVNKFYSNPVVADTNGDGLYDGLECVEKTVTNSARCTDTNGDGVPNFVSFDNDGDKVPDQADLSPNDASAITYTDANPYGFKILNTALTSKPLTVDIQIRPAKDALLYANNAIYDWPTADKDGQIQRGKTTTFASSTVFNATDATASNGDIKVTAMLEIRIPVSSGQYGNLPTKACPADLTNIVKLNPADANSCVDTSKTNPYGLSIGWSRDTQGNSKTNEVTISSPLNPDYDISGSIVAYSTKMYYQTGAQAWTTNHQVRLQWLVSSIQDSCPADKVECTDAERVEFSSLLQSYYGDWNLVGMQATENLGAKATLVYEDVTKAEVNDASKRRLAITQLANVVKNSFVDLPFLQISGTDTDKSLSVLFDNTRNTAAAVATTAYGINKSSTRASTFTYDTMLHMVAVNTTEIPKILNASLCRKNTKADACAEAATYRAACESKTTIECRLGMVIATETTERNVSLSFSDNKLDFLNEDETISRTTNGLMYRVKGGQWVAVTDSEDVATELSLVQQQFVRGATPTALTEKEWNTLNQTLLLATLTSFGTPVAKGYKKSQISAILAGVTKARFTTGIKTLWGDEITNTYTTYAPFINKQILQFRLASVAGASKMSDSATNIGNSFEVAVSVIPALTEAVADVTAGLADISLKSKASILVAAIATFNAAFSLGTTFDASGTVSPKMQALLINSVNLVLAVRETVNAVKAVSAAVKAAGSLSGAMTKAASVAATAAKAGTAAKFMKVLGPVMIGLAIAATWAVGIIAAINAEYGWQKGNAIAGMIGQTIAILFVLALTAIPVVGQIIGAVIAVLDALAAIACATLSEKEQRSTAGKWLCGGITGILANFFTPYASNIVVDPDDPWSRYMKVDGVSPQIKNPSAGFRVGNSMTNGIKVTDYIERMPFPSTWMALPWFWQWNRQDTRDASFNYALNPAQINMSGSISTGSQRGQWTANSYCDSAVEGCEYYVDGEKTYQYRKSVTINYDAPFDSSGINVSQPDLYLSTAYKVPQQTCFLLFIFIAVIPICYIETHTGNPKYININETSKTKYDIFPATFEEFIALRADAQGYTFAWSPLDAVPAFPTFIDADNDGLSNAIEVTMGSRDNAYDSDADGVADNREKAIGTLAGNPDTDNDGLTDAQEAQFKTDPVAADTDGDGLLDGEEVVHMRNGVVTGGWDVVYAIVDGVPSMTWTGSDPNSADADNDGIIDLREKVLGWSPYAKNSGEILAVNGGLREALAPLIQVGFERQATGAFVGNGSAATTLRCIGTCPAINATERPGNPQSVFTGAQGLSAGTGNQSLFSTQFTLSLSLKPTVAAYQTLFNQFGHVAVLRTATGAIRVMLETTNGIVDFTSAPIVPLNRWSHLAVTYGDSALVIYVDGVEATRTKVGTILRDTVVSDSELTIGSYTLNYVPKFVGGIDDVAVYQIALRPTEVAMLKIGTLPNSSDFVVRPGDRVTYSVNSTNKLLGRSMQGLTTVTGTSEKNAYSTDKTIAMGLAAAATSSFDGTFAVPGSVNNATSQSVYTNSCVFADNQLCVKFDEVPASYPFSFTDVSANESHLTCASAVACPQYTASDGSWRFTSNTALSTTPAVGNTISFQDMSIALWVRPEGQSTATRTIVQSSNTGAPLQVALALEKPIFTLGGSTLSAPNALPLNTWAHLAFVLEKQKRSIYVNGILVASESTPVAYPGSFGSLRIGRDAAANSFAGSLRDIQIQSRSLSAQQLRMLANTCEDPALMSCLPLVAADGTTDYSTYGQTQSVSVSGAEVNNFTSAAQYPTGFATLLTNHDFTLITKVKIAALTQIIAQTGTAVSGGNQFKLWVNNGVPTLTMGSVSATTTARMAVGSWYVIAARVSNGTLALRLITATGETSGAQRTGDALLKGQEPLTFGASAMNLDAFRLYRTAVSDATILAVAQYALNGRLTVGLNRPPVSDQMDVSVDARPKIIVPDANFERMPDTCSAMTAAVCLPFTSANYGFNASYTASATATQSTYYGLGFVASHAIDNNVGTITHTGLVWIFPENKPWLEIDLGSVKPIHTIQVSNRTDCCSERLNSAIVFLGNTSFGRESDLNRNAANAVAWRSVFCNTASLSCNGSAPVSTVTFPDGTAARYVRIQLQGMNFLHVREVAVNGKFFSCEQDGTCPTVSNGGTEFVSGRRIGMSQTSSKTIFEGDKNFTVMGWFKFNNPAAESLIVGDNADVTSAFNRLKIGVKSNRMFMSFGGSSEQLGSATGTITANTWHHLAYVKSGRTTTMYFNGIEVANATASGTANLTGVRQVTIGATNTGEANLNGLMRNFEIHTAALTPSQITTVAESPVYELRFALDEPALSTTFGETTSSAVALTCLSACPMSGVPGRDATALRFDGTQSLAPKTSETTQMMSYLMPRTTIPWSWSPPVDSLSYTVGLWVKPTTHNSWLIGNTSSLQPLRLGINANGAVTFERSKECWQQLWVYIGYTCYSSTPLVSVATLPINTWSHVVVSVVNGNEMISVNGIATTRSNAQTTSYRGASLTQTALTFGEGFVGELDDITISSVPTTSGSAATALTKQSPSWNLRFEETLNSEQITVANGITKTEQIDSVALPDGTYGRSGIQRYLYAASCNLPEITGAQCPVGDTRGMAGVADTFNGRNTLMTVSNGLGITQDIAAGGTFQLMIKPEQLTGTQTILSYGNATGTDSWRVQIVDGKVRFALGTRTFTASNKLAPAWNHVAFSFSTGAGSKATLYQNGNEDAAMVSSTSGDIASLGANNAYKFRIGGKILNGAFHEMFRGGIDDITLTPSKIPNPKAFRIARSQFSQSFAKAKLGSITIDADVPTIKITNPQYVSRLPQQFIVETNDSSSYISRVTAGITSTLSATGAIVSATTAAIAAPVCADAAAGKSYCPTFEVSQSPSRPVEGKYGIIFNAYDAVNNRAYGQSMILVDTTAPRSGSVSLIRPTGTYTTTREANAPYHSILVNIAASDPALTNAGGMPGSGVAAVYVNIKDNSGRTINTMPIPATKRGSVWRARMELPFGNPSGYYQLAVIARDAVGNQSTEITIADASNPIHVDGSAPRDTVAFPSPYDANQYFVGNEQLSGRISDFTDGRAPLAEGMRIRVDFNAPDGTKAFDNRADNRYNISCATCPIIGVDSTDTTRRVARFNIDAPSQHLIITNGATVMTGTFSIVINAKITNNGTLVSAGIASNPRFRLRAERAGTSYRVVAQRGTTSVATPGTLRANTWYTFIYNEFRNGTVPTMTLWYGTDLRAMQSAPTTSSVSKPIGTPGNTPVMADITLGAMQSSALTAAREDFFRGSLDDFILSSTIISPRDLIGPSVSVGSAATRHQTRLAIEEDAVTQTDGLADLAEFYQPMNQTSLPMVDSLNGTRSSRCIAGFTIDTSTCSAVTPGFSSNALTAAVATDGVQSGYVLTTTATTQKTIATRIKLNADSQSGLLWWLQPDATSDSLAFQVTYDRTLQQLGFVLNDRDAAYVRTTDTAVTIDDDAWHTVMLTTVGTTVGEDVTIYVDGVQILKTTVPGHWNGATLGIGALTGVTGYTNRGSISQAATGGMVDDLAVFSQALTTPNMVAYGFGYSTVLHVPLDDANIVAGAQIIDASPFGHAGVVRSSGALRTVIGTVGTAALNTAATDRLEVIDANGISFAAPDTAWSMSAWVKPTANNQTATIVTGTNQGYQYRLSTNAGKPRFEMSGIDVQSNVALSSAVASNIVVSNDGAIVKLIVDGIVQASATTTASGPSIPTNPEETLAFATSVQSSNDTSGGLYPATAALDGNVSTYTRTRTEAYPYWQASRVGLAEPQVVFDRFILRNSGVALLPLQNFYVFVMDTPLTSAGDGSIAALKQSAVWYTYYSGTVSDRAVIDLPPGIKGSTIRIVADNPNAALAIGEFTAVRLPRVVVGNGFVGVVDDVRVYRRALNSQDLARIRAMAWRTSTLEPQLDGFVWKQSQSVGIEASASLQSMSQDTNGNSQLSQGEKPLWAGNVDTLAPRVVKTISDKTLSVTIDDRNLDISQVTLPCGDADTQSLQRPNSLWFLQHMSVLDGTYSTPTKLEATCPITAGPEFIQTTTQVVSPTSVLAYGARFAYLGGMNSLSVLDVRAGLPLIQSTIPMRGNVQLITVNRNKTLAYVLGTTGTQSFLSILDIASSPLAPTVVGLLQLDLPAGIAYTAMGVSTNTAGDAFVILMDSATPQNITTINVTDTRAPIRGAITSITTGGMYDLAVSADIVATAAGESGIVLYRIGESGGLTAIDRIATPGYPHKVFFHANDLFVIDDDEDYTGSVEPSTANTLRVYPVITSIADGEATLVAPIIQRSEYQHTTPIDTDTLAFYRMYDIEQYHDNEILVLSTNLDPTTHQRVSLIDTAPATARLLSDTRIASTVPVGLASNTKKLIAMTKQGTLHRLYGLQVNDTRQDTTACDQRNNCTTVTSNITNTLVLGQNPPLQSSIRILNQSNVYGSTDQTIHLSAEAPLGINSIVLKANNQIVQTIPVSPTLTTYESMVTLALPSGIYTMTAELTDTQLVTTQSTILNTAVDATAPSIRIIDSVIGASQFVNDMFIIQMVITDDVGLEQLQIINTLTNAPIPFSSTQRTYDTTCRCVITDIRTAYNRRASDATGLPIRMTAIDRAGRSTQLTTTILFDSTPPTVLNPVLNANIAGATTSLAAEQVLTSNPPTDLAVAWSRITDISNIVLNQVEYTVQTISGTRQYTNTVPVSGLSVPAGSTAITNTSEASKMTFAMRLRDVLGNEGVTQLPSIYVDTPLTPDYTVVESTAPVYRGFLGNGCATLGEDRRATNRDIQRFAMTWDTQAIRLNYQGADWEYDGDLFVYLDTKVGGTVSSYRPSSYTKTITDSVTLGESYITLPVNTAARTIASSSTLASYINTFQTGLVASQRGVRANSPQGSDYVIHVQNRTVAQILRWDETARSWMNDGAAPTYQFVDELGIKQTDLRVAFGQIGYTTGNPFGVIAYATAPQGFLPWATFPSTNPIRTDQGSDLIAITPMINGYGWSSLNSGVCPNTTVNSPDTTRINATLRSTPGGSYQRAIADSYANTEPDAIVQIIEETAQICSLVPTNGWCKRVEEYAQTNSTGSALLDELSSGLLTEQSPVVGDGSVVTYTLTLSNPTNTRSRTMYAIVQTYGGIWLTEGNSTGAAPMTIIGGGTYDYHSISDPTLRDYHLIRINPIAANSSSTLSFRGSIDPNKAQSSSSDRTKTTTIAKVEVRITDDATATAINRARTLEWLNAAVAIDTEAPSTFAPDVQTSVRRGTTRFTGSVKDMSTIPLVELQYTTNLRTTPTQIQCGAAVVSRWTCPVTIAAGVTNVSYRLRASDAYGQQSDWTAWYGSTVDDQAPSFNFDAQTDAMVNAAYVGGTTIAINGFITDTLSTATVRVCDESLGTCADASSATITPSTLAPIVTSASPNQIVNAAPCATTDFSEYDTMEISQTSAGSTDRIASLSVAVNATSVAVETLNLWLQSPSGTIVPLLTSRRSAGTNLRAVFGDEHIATTDILTGTIDMASDPISVHPDGQLSTLIGEPVNGVWNLIACDQVGDSIQSTVADWAISFIPAAPFTSTNVPWNYTLQKTANIDNALRVLNIRGIDASTNSSTTRSLTLRIDTRAPSLMVTQRATTILKGTSAILFDGTVNEGGTLRSLSANIYDATSLVATELIPVVEDESTELDRLSFLHGKAIRTASWELPFDTATLSTGTYKIQFIAIDVAGNQTTSDAFTVLIPAVSIPELSSIQLPASGSGSALEITADVSTGSGPTTIQTSIDIDGIATAPITDTTLIVWDAAGQADTQSQTAITTTLQNTLFAQLELNDHVAAALDTNGTLTTWDLGTDTIGLAEPLNNIVQFALGDSDNQRLLTLNTTGVITSYTALGNETIALGAPAVSVAAGTFHSLALTVNGDVYGWGSNANNAIITGDPTVPITTPVRTGLTDVTQIAAGLNFSMALRSDGQVHAWGDNTLGQATVPTAARADVIQIAAGDSHALALRADGTVIAWGSNAAGQTTIPVGAVDVLYIVANAKSSAAVTRSGQIYVWGQTTLDANCCTGATTVALSTARTLTNGVRATRQQNRSLPASIAPVALQFRFSGLVHGRRYRYTVIVSNASGSRTYTGLYTSVHPFNRLFLPQIFVDSGATSSSTPSGK